MSFYDKDDAKVKADFKSCLAVDHDSFDTFKADMCTLMNKYSHGQSGDDILLEGAEQLLKIIPTHLANILPGDACTDDLKHIYHWHEKWGKKWTWELKSVAKINMLVQGGECRWEAQELTDAVNTRNPADFH